MLSPTAAGVGIGPGGEITGLTSGGINTGRMTFGGAGVLEHGNHLRDFRGSGAPDDVGGQHALAGHAVYVSRDTLVELARAFVGFF
jgi:hypothetical protein